MNSVAQESRTLKHFLAHGLTAKVHLVELYQQTKDIEFVYQRYHISKAPLMRWNKQYDGTKESLMPNSHRSYSQYLNAHTEEKLKWIRDYRRRNPNISTCGLQQTAPGEGVQQTSGHIVSCICTDWLLEKSGIRQSKHLGHCYTPKELGKSGKWMYNMCQLPVLSAVTMKNSTSTP